MKWGLRAWIGRAGWLLLAVAAVFQLQYSLSHYSLPWLSKVWQVRQLPVWERSALFLEGEDFAGYVGFLRDNIPDNARVVLPPHLPPSPYQDLSFMQYFLAPREMLNCGVNEVNACILRVTGKTTYILGMPDFPPPELALRSKVYIPYKPGWGVYAPKP